MSIEDYKTGKDPLEKMDIGIMHLTKEWLKAQGIQASKIESETVNNSKVIFVDVDGDVVLDDFSLEDVSKIPSFIKFRNVNGKFILGNSK